MHVSLIQSGCNRSKLRHIKLQYHYIHDFVEKAGVIAELEMEIIAELSSKHMRLMGLGNECLDW